jgi:heme exporter protein A
MLEATDVTKNYGMRPVLRNVTIAVANGEFVAILGPNGAGKTTLLRVMATLVRPDHGTLTVAGVNALEQSARARSLIGFVSHHTLLYPDLTAAENLQFYARLYGLGQATRQGAEALDSQISEALRKVELLPRARDPVRTFSRGMVQRLSIARAVIHNPPLLLLDEPYTGLDQQSARNLSRLLRELAISGRAVIITTHEFSRGLEGTTRAIFLKTGKVAGELKDDISPERITEFFV